MRRWHREIPDPDFLVWSYGDASIVDRLLEGAVSKRKVPHAVEDLQRAVRSQERGVSAGYP
jgi:hypothetical protein